MSTILRYSSPAPSLSPSSCRNTLGHFATPSLTRQWSRPDTAAELARECVAYISYVEGLFGQNLSLRQAGYIPFGSSGASDMYGSEGSVSVIPSNSETQIFVNAFRDGVLFGHLMNSLHPDSIDTASLFYSSEPTQHAYGASSSVFSLVNRWTRRAKPLVSTSSTTAESVQTADAHRFFHVITNLNSILMKLTLAPFRLICTSHQFSAQDIFERGDVDMIMDLVWRLLRAHMLLNVSFDRHPELIRLSNGNLQGLVEGGHEQILLRWVNYHLEKAGSHRSVSCFSGDMSDSSVYVCLMSQIAPHESEERLLQAVLDLDSILDDPFSDEDALEIKTKRASFILENAKLLGCTSSLNIMPIDMATGNPRLHLLLCSALFERFIGIAPLPSELELRWMHEELARMHGKIQFLNATVHRLTEDREIEVENIREESLHSQFAIQKQIALREQELLGKLELARKEAADMVQREKQQSALLFDSLTNLQDVVESNVGRTLQYLQAFKERRKELFQDSKEYTITAFNNEGKRIVFKIPAPQLSQKCFFDMNSSLPPPSPSSPRPSSRLGQPQQRLGGIPAKSSVAESIGNATLASSLPVLKRHAKEVETSTEDLQTSIATPAPLYDNTKTSRRILSFVTSQASSVTHEGLVRCWSAPPDVQMTPLPSAEQNHYESMGSPRPPVATRGSSLGLPPLTNNAMGSLPKISSPLRQQQPGSSSIATTNQQVELLTAKVHGMVQAIMEENMQQIQQIQLLAAKVDEMNWLNSVMGDKVREFSESLIKSKRRNLR